MIEKIDDEYMNKYHVMSKINEIIDALNSSPVSKFLSKTAEQIQEEKYMQREKDNQLFMSAVQAMDVVVKWHDENAKDEYRILGLIDWNYIKQTLTEKGLL